MAAGRARGAAADTIMRGAECGLMMLCEWLSAMVFRVDVAFVKIGVGPCREAYDESTRPRISPVTVGPWLRS